MGRCRLPYTNRTILAEVGRREVVGVRQSDEDIPVPVDRHAAVTFDLRQCHLFAADGARIGDHTGERP